jgi:hypothetical protein
MFQEEAVVNSRASLALIVSLLLIVFLSTQSFGGSTSNGSASNTVGNTSQQSTQTNRTGKVAQQAPDDRFDITTNDGVTYRKCRIVRVEPDGITFSHSKGVAKIEFPQLPEEYSEAYDYDPEAAEEYSLAAEERQAEFAARQQKENAQHGANSDNQEDQHVARISDTQGRYSVSFSVFIDDDPDIIFVPGYRYCNWIFMNNWRRCGVPWRPVPPWLPTPVRPPPKPIAPPRGR